MKMAVIPKHSLLKVCASVTSSLFVSNPLRCRGKNHKNVSLTVIFLCIYNNNNIVNYFGYDYFAVKNLILKHLYQLKHFE